MLRFAISAAVCLTVGFLWAQERPRVEFQRDVQPILRRCVGCHGPNRHMSGLRLDRRFDALRGGTGPVIGPGNSAGSRLYQRLVGNAFGARMPPNGPLRPEQIDTIKTWIDQGADWPDEFAGDEASTPDPAAVELSDAVRAGDRAAFLEKLRTSPAAAKAKGVGGVTPLMTASMFGDVESVRALIGAGADPNARADGGTTALMWATDDVERVRVLVDAGARVNERSDEGYTALMIAAGRANSGAVVKLLLDRGATLVDAESSVYGDTVLTQAAYVASAPTFSMLVDRGADLKTMWPVAMALATHSGCTSCGELLLKAGNPTLMDLVINLLAPPLGDGRALKPFLERGADSKARNADGLTVLMRTAHSDLAPVESVQALLAGGAEVNYKSVRGETALALAKLHGATPVVDMLAKAGATGDPPAAAKVNQKAAASTRAAIARSLPPLQRTDEAFLRRAGCVSCHHNSLTAMTVAAARAQGMAVDESIAKTQTARIARYLTAWRERAVQSVGSAGDADGVSYALLALAAEKYPRDLTTDVTVRYLKNRQLPDGHWWILAHRPPIESSDIQVTAASMRALQLYAPPMQRAEYDQAIRRAADWLIASRPATTEEHTFRLMGISWAGADADLVQHGARGLVALQRPDGGWAQLPSLKSDAYATGQALVALRYAGVPLNDAAVKRGIQYLMSTQLEDGSWYVRTRALPVQPYFESGFPHGRDQWISAAATNWAAMALAMSSGPR